MPRLKTLLMLLSGFCLIATPAPGQELTKQNLLEQANREGKVVWYTSIGTTTWLGPMLDEWKRRYPAIELQIVEGSGFEQMERIRTERRASRSVADLISAGDMAVYQFADESALEPINVDLLSNYASLSPRLKPILDPKLRNIPTWMQAYGLVVNTAQVAEKDWPTKWADLLSERYNRKMALQGWDRVGGSLTWLMIGSPVLGEKYFADIIGQKPQFIVREPEIVAAVARGERTVGVPARSGGLAAFKGAPVKLIYPDDGAFFIASNTGIVANAPHRAAAMLFLDFLISRPVQEQLVRNGVIAVRDDVPSEVSLSNARFLGVGMLTPADLPKLQPSLERARKLMQ